MSSRACTRGTHRIRFPEVHSASTYKSNKALQEPGQCSIFHCWYEHCTQTHIRFPIEQLCRVTDKLNMHKESQSKIDFNSDKSRAFSQTFNYAVSKDDVGLKKEKKKKKRNTYKLESCWHYAYWYKRDWKNVFSLSSACLYFNFPQLYITQLGALCAIQTAHIKLIYIILSTGADKHRQFFFHSILCSISVQCQ